MLDRQGKLKGDLNIIQRSGLLWLMGQEIKDEIEMDKIRFQHQALANSGGIEYAKSLFAEEEQEEEWITPTNLDEVDALLKSLGQTAQPL